MSDPLDPTLYTYELPQRGRDAYKAAQSKLNGWMPSEHLRFIERYAPARRILQQLWVSTTHPEYAEWRDVPLEEETPRTPADV